jgi:hypothetical protein
MPASPYGAVPTARTGHCTSITGSVTKYSLTGQERELWNPWTPGGRLGTAGDELRFVAELRLLAATAAPRADDTVDVHQRLDITAVVTALRGGVRVADMLGRAPGLRADLLIAAYEELDDRRSRSELAWRTIVDTADSESLAIHGPVAAKLLPVVIGHLTALRLRRAGDDLAFAEAVRSIDDEISRTVATVEKLEAKLDAGTMSDARQHQIGELLFDRYGEGAWSLNTFLSPRVGSLISVRVEALLDD